VKTTPLYLNNNGKHDGYCNLVEVWGTDERIVESARMSTDGAARGWGTPEAPGDEKLLRFLWANHHATPFEFAGMTVEFQVPIFVIRQVHRHRAAGYNELSARYTSMPELFWLPPASEIRRQGGSNRQGSLVDDSEDWAKVQEEAVDIMAAIYDRCREQYELLLQMGVAKEQARSVLPVAQFTRCRMTTNLRMWLHFLGLRDDAHAQPETRALARACADFLREAFPRTLALFDEGRAA
jgi:thymidylate synthase (FAD)